MKRMGSQRMHAFVSPDGTRYVTPAEFCPSWRRQRPRGVNGSHLEQLPAKFNTRKAT